MGAEELKEEEVKEEEVKEEEVKEEEVKEEKVESTEDGYIFNGVKIDKATADALILKGYEAYQQEKVTPEKEEEKEEPKDELESLKAQQKTLRDELKATKTDIENQRTYNAMLQQMNILVKNSEFLQKYPEESQDIQEQVLLQLHANPKQTIQTAFDRIIKKEESKTQRTIAGYTKQKLVDKEKTTTERGSGASQIENREPMTAADIKKGVAKRLLFEQLGVS